VKIAEGRITGYDVEADAQQNTRLLERLSFSFARIDVSYTGQDATGAGLGTTNFVAETNTV
jgi:type VI protein secretion system component Hcp